MSYTSYDTQDRKHRSDRHQNRDSRRDRPLYREEEIVEARTGPRASHQMDLIRRREDSVEEVERDFPPGDAYVQRRSTRRARSDGRGRYEGDDYYDDRRRSTRHDGGKSHRRRDYPSSSSSESPPRNRRRKSLGEQALAALGIGGALGAATRHRSRSQDRGRGGSRRRHRSYSSSRSPSEDRSKKIQQAVKAALTAGATEAFRSRKEPGGWGGAKGRRVLTAAIGAGGIDGLSNKNPDKKGTRHTIEAVIGGLAGNRILNGPRDKSASRSRSRSRVRSRARSRGGEGGGGLKGLAAGGLVAAASKAFMDARNRSNSRGRRSYSSSSDSRSPRRSKKRSKSVSDYVSQGMAALGLGEGGKDKHRDDHQGSRRDRNDPYYEDDYRGPPQGRLRGGGGEGGQGIEGGSKSDSSSDEISSSEEERTEKKMRGKEFLTAGLASVATIHAAHSVYKSVDNRKKRNKLVKKGEMSPEESHKLKNKARLQDAAAVGIAALGIKGAVSEWKEMNEKRVELRDYSQKRVERHEKRLHKLEENMARNENYRRSAPNLNERLYESGPRYQDGNPYHTGSALPPPPMGPQQAQYY